MPTKLFVGGIPYRATDEELRQMFSQAGEVTSVFIPMDRETQRPRGFAFVEMVDQASATKAIEALNERELDGRQLNVNEARERTSRAGGGGGARY